MPNVALAGLSLLVVEDDLLLRKQIAAYLQRLSADVTSANGVADARRLAADLNFDFVLLDVNLPDGSGLDLLRDKTFSSSSGVIVMTADGGVSGAVEAMKLGAGDYLVKPFELGELPLVIGRARQTRQSGRLAEHRRTRATEAGNAFFFGKSLAGLEKLVEKILEADVRIHEHLSPVLIQGETGTGKTTIARWLHHRGPRANQPLVEMNCSALPETLAESELFGHERGAFTDARAARIGLFEAADGGTLFLDELTSLSLGLQAKLLKALEDHRVRRLGSNKEIPVDVRVITATARNLKQLVESGQFREDLYHRLDLFRISIPPLRERGEDISALAALLVEQLCQRHRLPRKSLSAVGHQRLLTYRWPGNVRELTHELERALVFEESEQLDLDQLQAAIAPGAMPLKENGAWFDPAFVFPSHGFNLEEAINQLIDHALKQSGHNVSAAARLLGVSRDYVRYRLSGQKASKPAGTFSPDKERCG